MTRMLWIGLFWPVTVFPAENRILSTTARSLSYTDALNWLASLLMVLAIFFLCVWVMRKSGKITSVGKNRISVLSGLSLGMREKLVLIKVGDRQLLLGVTPGRISKLLELQGDEQLFQDTDGTQRGEFGRKLLRAMQGRSDA